MKEKGFVEDRDHQHWSDIPQGFNESIHFAWCPVCDKPMVLVRGMDPVKELAFRDSNKVVAVNGPQRSETTK